MSLMSLDSSSLRNALGIPLTRKPIDGIAFVSYVLPPLVCYFIAAGLAVSTQRRTIRLAFWPLVSSLSLRAALSVDMSLGKPELKFNNTNFTLLMLSCAARSFGWALIKGPLIRHLRPANSSPSTIMDAFDLAANFRGHGWNWSHYQSYIPPETRPTTRTSFIFYVSLSAVAHILICGASYRAVLTLVPEGAQSTIFDVTLPLPERYLRASIISIFTAISIYAVMQMAYDLYTIPAILVVGQDPVQWPPAFDAPWCATSLSDFWGRRWHQFFRHTFLLLGYPLSFFFGRPGIVIGTFLASVLWHHTSLMTLGDHVEVWWMLAGFGMMAPGVLAERAFYRLTGRRVGGVLGWIWTMSWLVLWGNFITEGFARGGMFECSSPFDSKSPLRAPVERLMVDFDAWLHSF